VWKAFWKDGSFGAYPAAASWSVPLKIELCSTRTQKWASGAGTPWPGHRKGAPDARKAYARRVSEAGRDRRASSGGRATPHEGDHEARDRVGSQLGPLKGKTPEATVAAILAVGSKPGGFVQASRQGQLHACRRSRRVGVCQAEEARGEAPPEATVRKCSEANVAERSDSGLEFIPEGSNDGG
jgi:hypothetical protein